MLPELSCSFQHPVGFERRISFDSLRDLREFCARVEDHVNMVCHYDPSE